MKTIKILLVLSIMASTTSFAQETIERNIEDITLGKTLKVQAARILKEKGINVGNKIWDFREHPEELPVQIDDSIKYMDIKWDGILFNTTPSKVVYRFCYLQNDRKEVEISESYNAVKLQLDKKYSSFRIEESDYNTTYNDGRTEISLWKTTETSLRLCYHATEPDSEDD